MKESTKTGLVSIVAGTLAVVGGFVLYDNLVQDARSFFQPIDHALSIVGRYSDRPLNMLPGLFQGGGVVAVAYGLYKIIKGDSPASDNSAGGESGAGGSN